MNGIKSAKDGEAERSNSNTDRDKNNMHWIDRANKWLVVEVVSRIFGVCVCLLGVCACICILCACAVGCVRDSNLSIRIS